ncbi:nitrite reductase large subunit NirB [Mangrovibacter phragmitis]|uniref:nitrite reductase large subunit NirB n=1 Tax=Mangrovibacter phragmitis TaxID=1691903 RepID=UPI0035136B06
MKPHLVVAGNGMAALKLVETLLALAPGRFKVTLIGNEQHATYNRVQLPSVLNGDKSFAEIALHPSSWYLEQGVTLLTGETVLSVHRESRQVVTDKRALVWDQLVIATGSQSAMPPVTGIQLPHVCGFRHQQDLFALQNDPPGTPVIVLGGGFVGVEAAAALAQQGRQVSLVHRHGWPLERQVDAKCGERLLSALSQQGVHCLMNNGITAITADAVRLTDGQLLPAKRVVIATGIRPNITLAREAGLACGRGIQVNGQLQTSDHTISALGECSEFNGEVPGLLAPCLEQAVVLAHRLAGQAIADYHPEPQGTRLKVRGLQLFCLGSRQEQENTPPLISENTSTGDYQRLYTCNGHLTGAFLWGDISEAARIRALMHQPIHFHALLPGVPSLEAAPTARTEVMQYINTHTKKTLVVIGHGMVGQYFLEQLVEQGMHQQWHIVVYGEERHLAYDRVHLTDYFTTGNANTLSLTDADFFAQHGIELRTHSQVTALDTDRRSLTDAQGRELAWDHLVLATGSRAFVPPIEGHDDQRCFVYRTLDDLDAIKACASHASRGVVIGGGLLGLEAANALKTLGLETHVVEFSPRLMAVQLDDEGATLLSSKIQALGVHVHTGMQTTKIASGASGLQLQFSSGEPLDTDLVVFSAGIRPRDDLARIAGLATGPRGGIIIDNQCRTSHPAVYAIGECALWEGMAFGLVAPGYDMARIAAAQLSGEQEALFSGADMSTRLKLLGVEVASLGDAHGQTPGSLVYQWHNGPDGIYKKIVVSADKKQLLGGVLVGDASDYSNLLQLMLNHIDLPDSPAQLILPATGDKPATQGSKALPDSAVLCSCHNVTKGAIRAAVTAGHHDLSAVKSFTKAGTGCGGCTALVKQVMEQALEESGVAVSDDICEHFPWSRQALFNLIQVENIRSFDELIQRHGSGHGCEICKPLVGSLLASAWNDYLLKPEHLPLQDTNDRYFANIQKNGTYSIVPRIPAGEITPQGLIAIGEVAQRYNLYTKITGGQRIDLFGATLAQLPLIWQELIDAGFETGHAYGKSLRTVKSCVGENWCRYGVQDSTSMAIKLEQRYKGLRSPHKIKMAVSGCTRECAEAQSKDIGVIATDKGWNLYVCGNGGMKPRHADLFATDLDSETLIRYIDRVLMFYIRTAGRLTRTSVWLDNLEGGLDYLRQVVIDDKLGINAQLEAHMAHIVDTWQCEWQTTLNDPEQLARFTATINSNTPDESVQWDTRRGQIQPTTALITHQSRLPAEPWQTVCAISAIPNNAGIGARLGSHRIALFRIGEQVWALDDIEPGTQACVMSRGLLGDNAGELIVISPLYKHRFRLADGRALEGETHLRSWPVHVVNGQVLVASEPATHSEPVAEATV